jgi:hypothetical protein
VPTVVLNNKLQEGIDYYIDERTGYFVFTALYLSQRGKCCGNKCKHCPFIPEWIKGNKILDKEK